jgi:hypothetical protein
VSFTARVVEWLVAAAASDASGKHHPHRFREAVALLGGSIDGILKKFGLLDLLNTRLAEGVAPSKWTNANLGQLRNEFGALGEWREWNPKGKDDGESLKFRKTLCPVWRPFFSRLECSERDTTTSIVLQFHLKLELKAKWIAGCRLVLSWTEWHLLKKDGSFTRFFFNSDAGQIQRYVSNNPANSDHQFGHS